MAEEEELPLGHLTDAEEEAAKEGLQEFVLTHWQAHPCPICGTNNWLTTGLGQLHNYGRGVPAGGGRHWPLGVVQCGKCHYVVLLAIGRELKEWLASAETDPATDTPAPTGDQEAEGT
ncbi:MAG TPA: hypothetical protein VIG64_08245 [Actinomycetota bacterium]|jgi:hypothetical protein